MARLSKEERADLEARLAADDEGDDDDEVEIGHGDKTFRGSYRRARGVAAAWGIKLEADPPADKADPKDKDKGDAGGTRFAGRRVS